MKIKHIIGFLFSIVLLMVLISTLPLQSVNAQTNNPPTIHEDKAVIGQNFTLLENQKLEGDLAIIGGTVTLSKNSIIDGDVVLLGGDLSVEGIINGNVQAFGGSINLERTAKINGSIFNFGSNLTQKEGAVISGEQITNLPFHFNFGNTFVPTQPDPLKTASSKLFAFIGKFLFAVLQIVSLSALALLLVLIAPKASYRVASSIERQPFVQWGIGLLTFFAFPLGLLVLIITIILIPIALISILIFAVALIFGWIGTGYAIGKRLFTNSQNSTSPALVAATGTFILTFVARIVSEIPCIGILLVFFISLTGLGAVVLTLFGTRDYPPVSQKQRIDQQPYSATPNNIEVGSILADHNEDNLDDSEMLGDNSPDQDSSDDLHKSGGEL